MLKVLKKTALWFPIVLIGGATALVMLVGICWVIYTCFVSLHVVMGGKVWIAYVIVMLSVWLFVSLSILEKE